MEIRSQLITILSKVFLISFICVLGLLVLSVFSINDIRGVESNVVYTLQQILVNNNNLYQDPAIIPYAVTQYSPLYYILNDTVLSVIGIDSFNVLGIRIISRTVSFIILICTCYVFYKIITSYLKLKKSLAIMLTLLIVVFTFPWYSLSRPDVLILFFIILSIFILLKYLDKRRLRYILGLGSLLFLSVMSKQNGMFVILVFGLFFLLNREWKSILFMFFGFLGSGILFYLFLVIAGYDISFIKANIVDGLNNSVDFQYAINKPYKKFIIYFTLFTIGAIVIIKNHFKPWLKPQLTFRFLIVLSILIMFLFSTITAVKVGSGVNYFNEFLVLMLLAIAYSIRNISDRFIKQKINIFLCVIGIQVSVIHCFTYSTKILRGINETYLSSNTMREDIVAFLDENLHDKNFFSDDRLIGLLRHDKCILPQIEIYETTLDSPIKYYSNLQKDFKDGTIKYLILHTKLRPILNIDVSKNFEFDRQIGNLNIYKFKT